eukprot:1138735-Pelagomonas_calceolata.AAC.4
MTLNQDFHGPNTLTLYYWCINGAQFEMQSTGGSAHPPPGTSSTRIPKDATLNDLPGNPPQGPPVPGVPKEASPIFLPGGRWQS